MNEYHVIEVITYEVIDEQGFCMDSFESESEADKYKKECEEEERARVADNAY